jgi:protein TonB
MQRPNHDLDVLKMSSKGSRTVGLAFVIGIHIIIVAALIIGLRQAALHKELLALNASVERAKVIPKAPPPPPPDLIRPPPTATIIPEFAIQAPPKAAPPPPPPPPAPVAKPAPPPPPTQLKIIARTHTLPPYPTISQRLGEHGTTILKVTVGIDGRVTMAVLEKTSGSDRLDQAAIEYVQKNYRWEPPTQEGKPVVAVTLVNVVWDLKDAQ